MACGACLRVDSRGGVLRRRFVGSRFGRIVARAGNRFACMSRGQSVESLACLAVRRAGFASLCRCIEPASRLSPCSPGEQARGRLAEQLRDSPDDGGGGQETGGASRGIALPPTILRRFGCRLGILYYSGMDSRIDG